MNPQRLCAPSLLVIIDIQGATSLTTLIKMTIWWCPNASHHPTHSRGYCTPLVFSKRGVPPSLLCVGCNSHCNIFWQLWLNKEKRHSRRYYTPLKGVCHSVNYVCGVTAQCNIFWQLLRSSNGQLFMRRSEWQTFLVCYWNGNLNNCLLFTCLLSNWNRLLSNCNWASEYCMIWNLNT